MTRSRRTFTAQEKAAIVLRHLVDKTPVSDLSDEFGLQPTQIYAWQKQLTANAALAFESPRGLSDGATHLLFIHFHCHRRTGLEFLAPSGFPCCRKM